MLCIFTFSLYFLYFGSFLCIFWNNSVILAFLKKIFNLFFIFFILAFIFFIFWKKSLILSGILYFILYLGVMIFYILLFILVCSVFTLYFGVNIKIQSEFCIFWGINRALRKLVRNMRMIQNFSENIFEDEPNDKSITKRK